MGVTPCVGIVPPDITGKFVDCPVQCECPRYRQGLTKQYEHRETICLNFYSSLTKKSNHLRAC